MLFSKDRKNMTMEDRILDKKATAQIIINKCGSGIGFGMNMNEFNKKKDDVKFLIDSCDFLRLKPQYIN